MCLNPFCYETPKRHDKKNAMEKKQKKKKQVAVLFWGRGKITSLSSFCFSRRPLLRLRTSAGEVQGEGQGQGQ
jgi:hypothetical protein